MVVVLALVLAIGAGVSAEAQSASSPEVLAERSVIGGDVPQLKNLRERLRSEGGSPYTLAYVDWRLWSALPKGERKACASEAEEALDKLIEAEPDNAERELRCAVGLFDRESPDKPWPNWGRAEAPGYRWIRDELLPALEGAE